MIWFLQKKEKPVKKEMRIVGIDDAPFSKQKKGRVLVLGTVHRGGGCLEGVMSTYIQVDGEDSTDQICKMINNSKHKDQLQCILTDGIAVGGFNVIDVKELSRRTKLPVIVIMRNKPNMRRVKAALNNVTGYKTKYKLIKKAGMVKEAKIGDGKIYFQNRGVSTGKAREIIQIAVSRGHMPEPIRTAHIIASGIVEGESRGRA